MKIPKEVKIGALTYKISLVDSINENPQTLGESNHNLLTIKIRKGNQLAMENTFIHEILHCFNSEWENELLVETLSNGLLLFLKANPGVFK